MSKVLSFHADPQHGWLSAPIDEIRTAGLSITDYSYIDRDAGLAYLEEDRDAMVYINYLKEKNIPFTVSETHLNHEHPIRRMERWPESWNPSND